MADIDRLISQKESEIATLKGQIKALRKAKKIVDSLSTPAKKSAKKAKRAPRGAKKARVLAAMTSKPQRTRDIAEKAGLAPQEVASALVNALKKGEVKKGRARGTYALKGSKKG